MPGAPKDSRVERGCRRSGSALPLVEPDVQISRIRLSRKAFGSRSAKQQRTKSSDMYIPCFYPQLLSPSGSCPREIRFLLSRILGRRHSQSDRHFSVSARLTPRLLGSTGITPLPRYYGSVRLPVMAASQVIDSLSGLSALPGAMMGLPGSRLIFRHALPSLTPDGPADASVRFFSADDRLRPIREVGHHHLCNEAETGSLALRLATLPSRGFHPLSPLAFARRPASSPDWVTPHKEAAATC